MSTARVFGAEMENGAAARFCETVEKALLDAGFMRYDPITYCAYYSMKGPRSGKEVAISMGVFKRLVPVVSYDAEEAALAAAQALGAHRVTMAIHPEYAQTVKGWAIEVGMSLYHGRGTVVVTARPTPDLDHLSRQVDHEDEAALQTPQQ